MAALRIDGVGGRLGRVAAVADEAAFEDGCELGEGERRAVAVVAGRLGAPKPGVAGLRLANAIGHVEVGDADAVEARGVVQEHLGHVGRAHTVEAVVGCDLDADLGHREGLRDGGQHVFEHREALLGRAAVLVLARVRARLQEGVEQVARARVHLDAIEASGLGELGRTAEGAHDLVNLLDAHLRWLLVLVPAVIRTLFGKQKPARHEREREKSVSANAGKRVG